MFIKKIYFKTIERESCTRVTQVTRVWVVRIVGELRWELGLEKKNFNLTIEWLWTFKNLCTDNKFK